MATSRSSNGSLKLKETLAGAKPSFKVVVMPDFFLDYILTYPGKLEELTAAFLEVAQRGGGNLLGWGHTVGRGGNASNMVAQLSKLGCEVVPIIETDELGRIVLQHFLKGVDLSHVRTTGTMSRTMSFETEHSGRRVNIMVSDPGSLSQFGPEKLSRFRLRSQLESEPEGDGARREGLLHRQERRKGRHLLRPGRSCTPSRRDRGAERTGSNSGTGRCT